MPQLNIYPEAGMGGETVVGSDDVSHHVMSQESFVNGEKSEDSDVPSYQLGLSAQELNDPAKIATAPLNQIATAFGIVIDKYTAREAAQTTSCVILSAARLTATKRLNLRGS